MSKIDKQKKKLEERIKTLESELRLSLQKKSSVAEISVSLYTSKILELKKQLRELT